jgi:hypothetical protein
MTHQQKRLDVRNQGLRLRDCPQLAPSADTTIASGGFVERLEFPICQECKETAASDLTPLCAVRGEYRPKYLTIAGEHWILRLLDVANCFTGRGASASAVSHRRRPESIDTASLA